MGRMRTLKPELMRSRELAGVPPEVRWTFAALMCFVDDEGRAEDEPRLIAADIYPRDDISPAAIDGHLSQLAAEDVGVVCRYTVAGRRYLHIPGFRDLPGQPDHLRTAWGQRPQRPYDSLLPPCEVTHSLNGQLPIPGLSANGESPLSASSSRSRSRSSSRGGSTRTSTRLPADWRPGPDLITWAKENFPAVDTTRQTAQFRDYWAAAPGARGVKSDWPATWRNWIRKADEFGDTRRGDDDGGEHIPDGWR